LVETKIEHTTEPQSTGSHSYRNEMTVPLISACRASTEFTGGPSAISSGVIYNVQCYPQMKEAVW